MAGLLILLLGPVAWWATPAKHLEGKDKAEVRNDTRQTLLAAVGGLVVLTGAAFTARSYYLTRRGQITDRYTMAIGQMASDKLTERLGGIYALEHLMAESDRDQDTVIEVLAAFVRERTQQAKESPTLIGPAGREHFLPAQVDRPMRPPTDVQAALTVLARRPERPELRPIDLARADLRGAFLAGARLQHAFLNEALLQDALLAGAQLHQASLQGAHLQGAVLIGAQLQGANLGGAQMQGAKLSSAQLQGANLGGAQMQGAKLPSAQLQGANLGGAQLQGADLRGAQLQGADLVSGLLFQDSGTRLQEAYLRQALLQGADLGLAKVSVEQLTNAVIDDHTRLAKDLREAWQAARPTELRNRGEAARDGMPQGRARRVPVDREAEGQRRSTPHSADQETGQARPGEKLPPGSHDHTS